MSETTENTNKRKHKTPPQCHHSVYDCPLLKVAKEKTLRYLCAEPIFVPQETTYGENKGNEEIFYDCLEGSDEDAKGNVETEHKSMADVIHRINNPHQFKALLREMAQTSHILYKSFKRAYHKAKKEENKIVDGKFKKCARKACGKGGDLKRDLENKYKYSHSQKLPLDVSSVVMSPCGMEIISDSKIETKDKKPSFERYWNVGADQNPNNCSPHGCPYLCAEHDKAYAGLNSCEKCDMLRGDLAEDAKSPLRGNTDNNVNKETMLEANVEVTDESSECSKADKKGEDVNIKTADCPLSNASDLSNLMAPPLEPCLNDEKSPTLRCTCGNKELQNHTDPRNIANDQSQLVGSKDFEPKHFGNINNCTCMPVTNTNDNLQQYKRTHPSSHNKSKSHKKHHHKSLQMQPISFILPINLQIQHGNGETQFVQTQIAMEAHAEIDQPKKKQSKLNKEFKHKAQILAAETQTADGQITGQCSAHVEQQTDNGKLHLTSDIFYSCSSSSLDLGPPVANRPCESLVEIFNIVKSRVEQDKHVPRQVLQAMVSCDINECVNKEMTTPIITEIVKTNMETEKSVEILKDVLDEELPHQHSSKEATAIPSEIIENIKFLNPSPKQSSWENKNNDGDPLKITTKLDFTEPLFSKMFEDVAAAIPSKLSTETKAENVKFSIPSKFEASTNEGKKLDQETMKITNKMLSKESMASTTFSAKSNPSFEPPNTDTMEAPTYLKSEQSFKTEEDKQKVSTTPLELKSECSIKFKNPNIAPSIATLDDIKSFGFPDLRTPTLNQESITEVLSRKSIDLSLESKPKPSINFSNFNKVSEEVQTDILSVQAEAHFQRNEMRNEIKNNLTELIYPTKTKYKPQEIEEILKDLYLIFNPATIARDTSREGALQLNSPESQKSITQENKHITKHIKLLDVGIILNPKCVLKPSKHYTKDQREQILIALQKILKPKAERINEALQEHYEILRNIHLILDEKHDIQIPQHSETALPTNKRNSIVEDIKYLLQIQNLKNLPGEFPTTSRNLTQPHIALPPPVRYKKFSEFQDELSSEENIQVDQNKKRGPPTPKKPKRKIQNPHKNEENENIRKSNE
ncbi:uncharacterized protein isoform X2 [Musca autumnalis]